MHLAAAPRIDSETRARRDEIIQEQVARETPWVMLVLAALIVFFDVTSALAGLVAPPGYYASDVLQGAFFLASAVLIMSGVVPARWAPWVFAAAVVVDVAALSYQHTVDDSGNAIGVILMTMVLFGGLLAMWAPFVVSAVVIVTIVSVTLIVADPTAAAPWIIATVTGVGASAALLFARRRSATDLAIATVTIERTATHDQLTGLLNRHGLYAAADRLVRVARRNGEPISAVFFDVTGLKAVNDRHGHAVGDLVITRCGEAVLAASRDADLVARWGGDEFLVVGLGAAPDPAHVLARMVASIDMTGLEGRWPGGVSVGTADSIDADLDTVIDAADAMMYASRRARPEEPAGH